jgi:hypothetical protein
MPNKLGVGGREFKTKPNPKGEGVFVYDPRTRFYGVERNLIWIVINDEEVYPLNGPSKMLTPSLKWPREADPKVWKTTGIETHNATTYGIKIVFGSKSEETPEETKTRPSAADAVLAQVDESMTPEEFKEFVKSLPAYKYKLKQGPWVGCQGLADIVNLSELAANGNGIAYGEMASRGVMHGVCSMFEEGEEVNRNRVFSREVAFDRRS